MGEKTGGEGAVSLDIARYLVSVSPSKQNTRDDQLVTYNTLSRAYTWCQQCISKGRMIDGTYFVFVRVGCVFEWILCDGR